MNQKNNIKVNLDCFYEILSLDIENLITDKILEHNLALKKINFRRGVKKNDSRRNV